MGRFPAWFLVRPRFPPVVLVEGLGLLSFDEALTDDNRLVIE
jgi:hypothetical protein